MTLRHVATESEWARWQREGAARPSSLESLGFVHLCTPEQLEGVLERFFANAGPLMILHVEEAALEHCRWELVDDVPGERFPHLYGPLPLSAVVKVEPRLVEEAPS